MASDSNRISELEAEKLELEIDHLKLPFWKKPAYLSIVIPLLVTVIITATSYYTTMASKYKQELEEIEQKNFELKTNMLLYRSDSLKSAITRMERDKIILNDLYLAKKDSLGTVYFNNVKAYNKQLLKLELQYATKVQEVADSNSILNKSVLLLDSSILATKLSIQNDLIDLYLREGRYEGVHLGAFKERVLASNESDKDLYKKLISNKLQLPYRLCKKLLLAYLLNACYEVNYEDEVTEILVKNTFDILYEDLYLLREMKAERLKKYDEILLTSFFNSNIVIDTAAVVWYFNKFAEISIDDFEAKQGFDHLVEIASIVGNKMLKQCRNDYDNSKSSHRLSTLVRPDILEHHMSLIWKLDKNLFANRCPDYWKYFVNSNYWVEFIFFNGRRISEICNIEPEPYMIMIEQSVLIKSKNPYSLLPEPYENISYGYPFTQSLERTYNPFYQPEYFRPFTASISKCLFEN